MGMYSIDFAIGGDERKDEREREKKGERRESVGLIISHQHLSDICPI